MYHYVCNECGKVFAEDEAGIEENPHTEVTPSYTEKFLVCPECGSANYDDAAYCYRCNSPVPYDDLRGGYYCGGCMELFMSDIYHIKEYVRENADDFAEWMHERLERRTNGNQD